MNELIQTIFNGFAVDGVSIPVKFIYYHGHGEPYITYAQTNADNALYGNDNLIGYVDYYDFDVYAKGDFLQIIERVKELLEEHDFLWMPSMSSPDFYETDTGYYHKTLCFAILKEETNG